MGYKVFNVGEEALAADVNGYLMSQTVSRFPSAATRAADLVGPIFNQLSMTDDRPGIVQRWNGAAWVDASATLLDAAGSSGGPLIQTGTTVGTTDPYGSLNAPFLTPFANANRRVTAINGDSNALDPIYRFWVGIVAGGDTASGTTFTCTMNSGPVASAIVRVNWIAIGVRP
jgi:hypothetical protein